MSRKNDFPEYELKEIGFKFKNDEAYTSVECVGSQEETMNSRIIVKKCRGVVTKKKVKGDGTGTLKISAHIPYEIFEKMYGLKLSSLKAGVGAYGRNSTHLEFSIVEKVVDEDDLVKYKAYPNCIVESGISRKIENGAEEVAELELEISVQPDQYGNGMYEALDDETFSDPAKSTWMTAFDPTSVQQA